MKLSIDRNTMQLLLVGAIIGVVRLFYVDVYEGLLDQFGFVLSNFLVEILRNFPVLLITVAADLFFIKISSKKTPYGKRPILRILVTFLYIIVISAVTSLAVNIHRITGGDMGSELIWGHLKLSFMAALLIHVVVTIVPAIIIYYVKSPRTALSLERSKKEKARFQYNQLKRQLNPHFLFNSLNILDYLIHLDTDRASAYVKKLAGVYRYMLGKELEAYVTLRDEMEFAGMYVDLLKERFAEGFIVVNKVEADYLDRLVIPCSIQILIENAINHNIVTPESPLTISLSVETNRLYVRNNLQPKLTKPETTGKGLKNIDGQFRDVFKENIEVVHGEKIFQVSIPLVDADKHNRIDR